jgi:hypothetical protein
MLFNARSVGQRARHGIIVAATIDDNSLVTECEGIKAIGDLGRFVPGDNNGGQRRHYYSPVDSRMGIPYSSPARHNLKQIARSLYVIARLRRAWLAITFLTWLDDGVIAGGCASDSCSPGARPLHTGREQQTGTCL